MAATLRSGNGVRYLLDFSLFRLFYRHKLSVSELLKSSLRWHSDKLKAKLRISWYNGWCSMVEDILTKINQRSANFSR